jgi:hypothetical protein
MREAPPPVVVRTKAMIARDIAEKQGMTRWEQRQLGGLSRTSLLGIARLAIPGYREVVETASEANR